MTSPSWHTAHALSSEYVTELQMHTDTSLASGAA